jgi:hypothetical protein
MGSRGGHNVPTFDSRLRLFTTDDLRYGYMMIIMHFAILQGDELPISPLRCFGQHGSEAVELAAEGNGNAFDR